MVKTGEKNVDLISNIIMILVNSTPNSIFQTHNVDKNHNLMKNVVSVMVIWDKINSIMVILNLY